MHHLAEERIVEYASRILRNRLRTPGVVFATPQVVQEYLRMHLGLLDYEMFHVLYLNAQRELIVAEDAFRGTLTQTSVYPREIVKAALRYNAAAVVFAHNHPSGSAEPSRADEVLTTVLKTALALVDVCVLDHVVVTSDRCVSFAERGLL